MDILHRRTVFAQCLPFWLRCFLYSSITSSFTSGAWSSPKTSVRFYQEIAVIAGLLCLHIHTEVNRSRCCVAVHKSELFRWKKEDILTTAEWRDIFHMYIHMFCPIHKGAATAISTLGRVRPGIPAKRGAGAVSVFAIVNQSVGGIQCTHLRCQLLVTFILTPPTPSHH